MFDLSSLNPQQRLAVETIKGPVLILAGAGTGKTRVITCRIAHMLARGVPAGRILAVTFTNKAAREMQERVRQMLPRKRKQQGEEREERPTVCTFHSLCVRILREHIEKLGYKRNFVIYDQSEQVAAIKKILSHISIKGDKVDPNEVLAMISRLKSGSKSFFHSDPTALAMAQHLRSKYETALRACNAVDFDDLIVLTLRLFKEHPDSLTACRAKYHYVMVDEYQDTNASQFELVHALTAEHRNLCVVGDDDQSIYGWRGAEIANLLDMEKHFPEVKVIKLEQNYRSTNTILNAANAIIKNNTRRRGKSLWSEKGDGPKIMRFTFSTDDEEAQRIVEEIEAARLTKRVPWSDQAILFRTNAQSRPIETALRKAGVRYHLIGGQSFFDRREIRDFVAYLKMFVNPHDDISLLRIANVPARGLSDVTMERLIQASHERKCSVFSVMKNPAVTTTFMGRTRESIEAFVGLVEHTRAPLLDNGGGQGAAALGTWADRFAEGIGFYAELKRGEKTADAGESRVRSIKDLIRVMGGVAPDQPSPLARLQTFLEDVTLESEREDDDEVTGEAVTLITMHSCKGLEFPHVYIVGLEDGLLPHERSKLENTVDEERRLFYVAVTRAMRSLTISHCLARMKYGEPIARHPSPFLSELPEELVENGDEKGKAPVKAEEGKSRFDALRAMLD